jgi:hypothetical protein
MTFEKIALVSALLFVPMAAVAADPGGNASVVALATPTATPTPTPTATPHPTAPPTPAPTATPFVPTAPPATVPPTAPPTPVPTATPAPAVPAATFVPLAAPSASPPSTPAPPRGVQRQILSPTNNTTKAYVNPQCSVNNARSATPLLQTGEVLVGWNFAQGVRCGVIYGSGVWFRDAAKGEKVVDATLTFYVASSASSAQGNPLTGNVSCAAQLQTANSMWMNNPDNPSALLGTPYLAFPANRPGDTETSGQFSISNGMFVSIDVTRAVQEWAAGTRPNYGFLLVPDRADFSGGADRCNSAYNGFTLTVDAH